MQRLKNASTQEELPNMASECIKKKIRPASQLYEPFRRTLRVLRACGTKKCFNKVFVHVFIAFCSICKRYQKRKDTFGMRFACRDALHLAVGRGRLICMFIRYIYILC